MKRMPLLFFAIASYIWLMADGKIPMPLPRTTFDLRLDTIVDTTKKPYNFHLYIVLRKKHYHALLTVKDTLDKIIFTKDIDSLRIGRNFFDIPTPKKLPPVVKWELKAGDLNKKGRMNIH
ncbi:MAG: hypothetical protein ABIO44_04180 [Saprospiraceae bacterium]